MLAFISPALFLFTVHIAMFAFRDWFFGYILNPLTSTTFQTTEFYNSLIPYLNKHHISVDLFAFCLTQFGLSEMRNLINKTGGLVVNDEEFSNSSFNMNFQSYFDRVLS